MLRLSTSPSPLYTYGLASRPTLLMPECKVRRTVPVRRHISPVTGDSAQRMRLLRCWQFHRSTATGNPVLKPSYQQHGHTCFPSPSDVTM